MYYLYLQKDSDGVIVTKESIEKNYKLLGVANSIEDLKTIIGDGDFLENYLGEISTLDFANGE